VKVLAIYSILNTSRRRWETHLCQRPRAFHRRRHVKFNMGKYFCQPL